MLTDADLDRHLGALNIPTAGRELVRKIRKHGPVRDLQRRMDGVRTRYISAKMDGRALLAESRTCEFLGIYTAEFDPSTLELWPQPYKFDLEVAGPKGKTRLQHTPDLLLIREHELVVEEWRMEERLQRLATERPLHFYKDEQGQWHYIPFEEHLKKLGLVYRLRSADEHPLDYTSNLMFLEDYTLDSAPPVPYDVSNKLAKLLETHRRVPHHELIEEHGFEADHIFQEVLSQRVYVNLYEVALRNTHDLVIYQNEAIATADKLLRQSQPAQYIPALSLAPGSKFNYDNRVYEIVLAGVTEVVAKDASGVPTQLPIALVEKLFKEQAIVSQTAVTLSEEDKNDFILHTADLERAAKKLAALNTPGLRKTSKRTAQRDRKRIAGIASVQGQLQALTRGKGGNTLTRLPDDVTEIAEKVFKEFYNKPQAPTVDAAFKEFVVECENLGIKPMCRAAFFKRAKKSKSILKRKGFRAHYKSAPIPLHFDYGHPVHGVLPHEIAYCDHTPVSVNTRGMKSGNLGRPVLTAIVDGALSKTRAFYLTYQPASALSVLMCLRDYVRRHNRLPRILVLDNGSEFHSYEFQQFCDLFGITIRWRRRSRPRDSAIVERMFGTVEQEFLAQLNGNTVGIKDHREVSSTHKPDKFIEWTLPALHRALDYFLFSLHPSRTHPRFGMSPNDMEKQMAMRMGARNHLLVRYDQTVRLLTCPTPKLKGYSVDKSRGVFVDGMFHWHPLMKDAKRAERVRVRLEPWRAEVIYVEIGGAWVVAQSRDSEAIQGRFRGEFAIQFREEKRSRKGSAQSDRNSAKNSRRAIAMWRPEQWDSRLREQFMEEYHLYAELGMAEALPEARNEWANKLALPLPKAPFMQFYPDYDDDVPPPESPAPAVERPLETDVSFLEDETTPPPIVLRSPRSTHHRPTDDTYELF